LSYTVRFKPLALRQLKKLPLQTRSRLFARIEALADDPRPLETEKLSGREETHRHRVGPCRIIYQIEDNLLLVLVLRVGHRREVYRSP
jgi:mRNA interferase RelE/StbE